MEKSPLRKEVRITWLWLEKNFGKVKFTKKEDLSKSKFCIGKQYFYSIPNGSNMKAVYDRQKNTFYFRTKQSALRDSLKHELFHKYLNLKKIPSKKHEKIIRFCLTGCAVHNKCPLCDAQ